MQPSQQWGSPSMTHCRLTRWGVLEGGCQVTAGEMAIIDGKAEFMDWFDVISDALLP